MAVFTAMATHVVGGGQSAAFWHARYWISVHSVGVHDVPPKIPSGTEAGQSVPSGPRISTQHFADKHPSGPSHECRMVAGGQLAVHEDVLGSRQQTSPLPKQFVGGQASGGGGAVRSCGHASVASEASEASAVASYASAPASLPWIDASAVDAASGSSALP